MSARQAQIPAWVLILIVTVIAIVIIFVAPLLAVRCTDVRSIDAGHSLLLAGCSK